VTITPEAQKELDVIYPPNIEPKIRFSKAEVEKIRAGLPIKGPGSRKGRGLAGRNGGPKKGSKQKAKTQEEESQSEQEEGFAVGGMFIVKGKTPSKKSKAGKADTADHVDEVDDADEADAADIANENETDEADEADREDKEDTPLREIDDI
jgi:hypothetical protein